MKTVLITGSSRGLGKSLAMAFARNKDHIILHGRDNIALKQVQEKILEVGATCIIITGDLTHKETIQKLTSASQHLDILINNAGIHQRSSFIAAEKRSIQQIIDTNLMAPIFLIYEILPIFQRKKSGLIININSIAGKSAGDKECAYSISKYGLRALSESLQFDVTTDGIRILDVYLGAMNTQMLRQSPQIYMEPDEVADIIFKMSQEYHSLRITEIHLRRRWYP